MLAALAPHCWNATSFAEPEYVMDFTSPKAVCALAITVLASCASAIPQRNARQTLIKTNFLNTASPYEPGCQAQRTRLEYSISTRAGVGYFPAAATSATGMPFAFINDSSSATVFGNASAPPREPPAPRAT